MEVYNVNYTLYVQDGEHEPTGALCLGKLVNDVLLDERCVASLEEHGARLFGDDSARQI